MTHAELKAALKTFGFSEHDRLTMAQIKRRYRELSRKNHPDLQGSDADMQGTNAAATLLMAYLTAYRFSFQEDEFYRQNPDERLRMQFSNDPVWGGS